ncbi:hypothetical protein YC2023_061478 [Brassica napus]
MVYTKPLRNNDLGCGPIINQNRVVIESLVDQALEEATIWTGVNKSNGPSLIHPSSIESMSTLAGFPSQAG